MSVITCPTIRYKTPTEVVNALFSFVGVLDKDASVNATLTGTPTITISPTGEGHMTASSPLVTTVARKVNTDSANPENVPAGKGVTCVLSGGQHDTEYTITVACDTSGGETKQRLFKMIASNT